MHNRLVVQLSLIFDKHQSGLSSELIDDICGKYDITSTMVNECFDFYLQKREETKAKIVLNKIPKKSYVYSSNNNKKNINKCTKTQKYKQTNTHTGINSCKMQFKSDECKTTMALALTKAGLI